MRVRHPEVQYIDGREFGFDKSVQIHVNAVMSGDILVGPNTRIDSGVVITGSVKIGRNCHIAGGAQLIGGEGIVIGDDCGISFFATLLTGTEDLKSGRLALHSGNERERAAKTGPIVLEQYCTVFAHGTILPGVKMEEGTVLAAHSMLSKSPAWGHAWSVYGGVPAKYMFPRPRLEYPK